MNQTHPAFHPRAGTDGDARPRLDVDLQALGDNYERVRAGVAGETAAVVKADAYGLGLEPVARALHARGCRTFFTAFTAEAVSLRGSLPQARIFVLAPLVESEHAALLANDLLPCLFDLAGVDAWCAAAAAAGRGARAALHVETGINRLGMPGAELRALRADRQRSARLDPVLLMSHLACADDPGAAHNEAQRETFEALRALYPGVPASLANSAGTFLGPPYHFDQVRAGICLYGHDPHSAHTAPRVRPVATLSAVLAQVRDLPAGSAVGYGATYRSDRDRRLGVVLAGYADGLARNLYDPARAGGAEFAIEGHRAPLVGRVSMDMCTLDLSAVPGAVCRPGARVEVFGPTIPVEEIAARSGTIAYETLTSVGARVRRRYRDRGQGRATTTGTQ